MIVQQYSPDLTSTHYFVAQKAGEWWNGSVYAAYNAANWATYVIAATHVGAGQYRGTIPDDADHFQLVIQTGGSPAVPPTDAIVATVVVVMRADNRDGDKIAEDTDIQTLLGRMTAARAGYLDNLNVGGAVASQADVTALNQSASRRVILTTVAYYERPESGTTSYTIEARTYDPDGAAVNATGTPTLTATGNVSGSLAANLSAATNPATGVYRWTYSCAAAATPEQIIFDISAVLADGTFTLAALSQVLDTVSSPWTAADRAKLDAIHAVAPDNKPTVNASGQISAIVDSVGAGAYQLTVTVTDADTDAVIPGATVLVTNTSTNLSLPTNSSGVANFGVTNGTYAITVSKTGYGSGVTNDYVISSANRSLAVELSPVDITPSADPDTTTAYTVIRDGQGDPVQNETITLRLWKAPEDTQAGNTYSFENFTSPASDVNGLIQVTLLREAQYSAKYKHGSPVTFTTGTAATFEIPYLKSRESI